MTARMRVISDNDYSGDPDGLVQLAHHALADSVDLRCVIGSHLRPGDPFDDSATTAENAARTARELLRLAGRGEVRVVAGSNVGLADRGAPVESAGARAIIDEAMADDDRPLYVCLGAGLTELASAWLLEPRIATRLTAVWIGGAEHSDDPDAVQAPPGAPACEYNTAIDPLAAQVVFNDSDLQLWQVPRDSYRQTLASFAEMRAGFVGPLGDHLYQALDRVRVMCAGVGLDIGETYVLGDSPLVLLTALQSSFEAWPSSSRSRLLPAPVLADDGSYSGQLMTDRTVRVWTQLDLRLMMADLYARLAEFKGAH